MKSSNVMARLALTLVCAVGLTGCATYEKHAEHVVAQPVEGKAILYFYREGQSAAGNCWIEREGFIVGKLDPYCYTFIYADPGIARYAARGDTDNYQYSFKIKRGETYYFRVSINHVSKILWHYEFRLVPESE